MLANRSDVRKITRLSSTFPLEGNRTKRIDILHQFNFGDLNSMMRLTVEPSTYKTAFHSSDFQ